MLNVFETISGKERKAETLVEVIMAILIVLIGSGAATVLLITSMQANTFNKDNLIGLNLAVEGIEAVRTIRDTNWIKFGHDRSNCWNMHPDKTAGEECIPDNRIAEYQYTVDLNPLNYSWTLTSKGHALDLANTALAEANQAYRMVFIDFNDTDVMVSKEAANRVFAESGGIITESGPTRFYRMVSVAYNAAGDVMNVESLVQWRGAGPAVHEVRLFSSLTNFNRVKVN